MSWESIWNGSIAAIIALIYLLVYLTIRWHLIVQPNQQFLQSTIKSIQADIQVKLEQIDSNQLSIQRQVLLQANALLEEANSLISQPTLWDKVFGYRGQLLAGWQLLHKSKRMLVSVLTDDLVLTQLVVSVEDLRGTGQPRAIVLADRIRARLDATVLSSDNTLPSSTKTTSVWKFWRPWRSSASLKMMEVEHREKSFIELRAWLHEALTIVFDHRDTTYGREATLHSKAMLLMVTALLLIVTLASFQNAVLLLVGSVGGFVSRLSRSLKIERVLNEYSTHWTGLFLSPLAGALAGWSGVLLVSSLVDKNILSKAFFEVAWSQPVESFTLGLAFLLGFSERFFNQISSVLQERTQQQTLPQSTN